MAVLVTQQRRTHPRDFLVTSDFLVTWCGGGFPPPAAAELQRTLPRPESADAPGLHGPLASQWGGIRGPTDEQRPQPTGRRCHACAGGTGPCRRAAGIRRRCRNGSQSFRTRDRVAEAAFEKGRCMEMRRDIGRDEQPAGAQSQVQVLRLDAAGGGDTHLRARPLPGRRDEPVHGEAQPKPLKGGGVKPPHSQQHIIGLRGGHVRIAYNTRIGNHSVYCCIIRVSSEWSDSIVHLSAQLATTSMHIFHLCTTPSSSSLPQQKLR